MIYFTADPHFFHDNIIRHTNRHFQSVAEMNEALIRKWNKKVTFRDEIYILGDFTMKGPGLAMEILRRLNGKIHLIRGNHDGFVDRPDFDQSLFASVQDYGELVY